MTDEQIKALAAMRVGWIAEWARLELGQSRPLNRCEDALTATLGAGYARFLPFFDGTGVLVIDVPPGAESPIFDRLLAERRAA